MTDILQAARSYYGLADTESCTTQLYTNQAGQACVAFEIALSNEDFAAIVERMKAMQQEESQQSDTVPLDIEMPDMADLRKEYNALSKAEKGRYGSFARYMTECSGGIVTANEQSTDDYGSTVLKRQVIHVDAPEEPEPVTMDAVWIDASEATQAQAQHKSDVCYETGRYLVQWAMLTDEQKQKAQEAKP